MADEQAQAIEGAVAKTFVNAKGESKDWIFRMTLRSLSMMDKALGPGWMDNAGEAFDLKKLGGEGIANLIVAMLKSDQKGITVDEVLDFIDVPMLEEIMEALGSSMDDFKDTQRKADKNLTKEGVGTAPDPLAQSKAKRPKAAREAAKTESPSPRPSATDE